MTEVVKPPSTDYAELIGCCDRVLILYDGAIIHGPDLQGGLAGTSEALKITMAPIPLQERFWLWQAVQKAYRISVTYEVRVVNLDAVEAQLVRPVAARDLGFHVPEAP